MASKQHAADNTAEVLVDPTDKAHVGGQRPWGIRDQRVPGDQATEVDSDGVGTLRATVPQVEPHTRVLLYHVYQLLGYDPVSDGGGVDPVEGEQPSTRAPLRAGSEEARVRFGRERRELGR